MSETAGERPETRPGLHAAVMRYTGYLLARAGAAGQTKFGERLQTLGLTPRTWGVMNVLDHEGPSTQQALGKLTLTDPSTMVATIDELEKHGLVQRHPHPTDRRAHQIHITDEGHDTLRRGRRLAAQAQAELLAPLSDSEREQLHDMLTRVVEHAGAAPPWFRGGGGASGGHGPPG